MANAGQWTGPSTVFQLCGLIWKLPPHVQFNSVLGSKITLEGRFVMAGMSYVVKYFPFDYQAVKFDEKLLL